MHRVRMSLPYLKDFGWEATVLAVEPAAVDGVVEPVLEATLPPDVAIVRTSALPLKWTRRIGLGNVGLRGLPYLWRKGNQLLRSQTFDLVFFSTTMFVVMILGPIWRRRFATPYVIDLQDPWRDDYYARSGVAPPGGRLKYGFSRLMARLEPTVMRSMSAAMVVSKAYSDTLLNRYAWLQSGRFAVIPFGAPERDFEFLEAASVTQTIFQKGDGLVHVVYVGRGGPDLAVSLRILFRAVRHGRLNDAARWEKVRLHFVGTSYAGAGTGTKTVEPIAREHEVLDIVEERTDRIPYFEALQALREADGLLILGSDSSSYIPSKIFPYVLACRPMLAILNKESPAVCILQTTRSAIVQTFPNGTTEEETDASPALATFFEMLQNGDVPATDWDAFAPYGAREMTRRMCELFNHAASTVSEIAVRPG
jgi:hypothetical protein